MKGTVVHIGTLFLGASCSSPTQAFVFPNHNIRYPHHASPLSYAAVTGPKKRSNTVRQINENHLLARNGARTTSTTQLYDGVIVAVADDFFTVTGLILGLTYTITRAVNRVVLENVAWENRLEDARENKLDNLDEGEISLYTELDLRREDAANSKSAYGQEAMEGRAGGRVEGRGRRRRVKTMEYGGFDDQELRDRDDDTDDDVGSGRKYTMTDEQILQFEDEYGVEYDPYYDEPYTEEELPDDMKFYKDKSYGDRRYENGEVFYQDENNKNIYWRQGGRPRLRQFWDYR